MASRSSVNANSKYGLGGFSCFLMNIDGAILKNSFEMLWFRFLLSSSSTFFLAYSGSMLRM